MHTLLTLVACAALAVACNKTEKPDSAGTTEVTGATAADNTKMNERDRSGASLTPVDQSNAREDIDTTARIRKVLMSDDTLSNDGKNVKIITQAGKVVLRGPVDTNAEKQTIESEAAQVAGVNQVENDLDVVIK